MTELRESPPPSASVTHAVADWLELECLSSPDGYVSLHELADERKRQQDTGQSSAEAGAELLLGLEGDALQPDDGILPVEGDQAARESTPDDVSYDEAIAVLPIPDTSGETGDVLAQLRSRSSLLRPARYPFDVRDESLRLREPLGAAHGIYVSLLLCSNLYRLPAVGRNEWTGGFERYCSHALARWLGPDYQVEVFGTAARQGERFHGNTRVALAKLCTALGWPLILTEEELRQLSASGDRGLDGVAWRSGPEDPADLWVTYFMQAGSGKDWPGKQDEASLERWGRSIGVKGPLQPVLAIPYWQRTNSGRWHGSITMSRANVLLDRLRLLGLATDRAALEEFPVTRVEQLIVRDAGKTDSLGAPVARTRAKGRAKRRSRRH